MGGQVFWTLVTKSVSISRQAARGGHQQPAAGGRVRGEQQQGGGQGGRGRPALPHLRGQETSGGDQQVWCVTTRVKSWCNSRHPTITFCKDMWLMIKHRSIKISKLIYLINLPKAGAAPRCPSSEWSPGPNMSRSWPRYGRMFHNPAVIQNCFVIFKWHDILNINDCWTFNVIFRFWRTLRSGESTCSE